MSHLGSKLTWNRACLAMLVVSLLPVSAQESKTPDEQTQEVREEMTVVGSRRRVERSKADTIVPVDVVPISEVASETGHLDLGALLQVSAPSFNSNRQSGSDGSDHVDAATLRGLGPDQVLVLVNGKRRHTSSLVFLFGTRARGNVGTDLNTIPVAAIKRIEILRDGAAAQYGSDAIAGVINIVLKDSTGVDTTLSAGRYQEGDGDYGQIALNYGLELKNKGILNVTGEFLTRDRTNRSPEGEPRIIGDSETENNTLFFNLEMPTNNDGAFYGHGGFNQRDGLAGAWYRGGIGSDDIPSRNSTQMYPDGFVPTITTDITDFSATAGYRRTVGSWFMDLSSTYGKNEMTYYIRDTLNASIATQNGGISPTGFDAGGFDFSQHTTNVDFSRYFDGVVNGLNVAMGAEYRKETYSITAGEDGSWRDYDGPGNGNAGSQGFPGFQPEDEVNEDRNSVAAYLDLELQLNEKTQLAAAIRAEDYSIFGSTAIGKLALSYHATDQTLIRGSISTGFRAPSLHQYYFSSTFTDFIAGEAADVKLSPNGSILAQLVGIPDLKEETSLNTTAGFTYKQENATYTLDAYLIDIDDRIVLTGGFTADDPDIGDIIAAQGLSEARFFTNAIDTRTKGIDFTYNRATQLSWGTLQSYLALNWNDTEVLRVNTAPGLAGKEDIYFNARERWFVEGSAPKEKATLGADVKFNSWHVDSRAVFFGQVKSGTWSQLDDPNSPPQKYDAAATLDVTIGYNIRENIRWNVGGTNIFDLRPTAQDPNETENGAPWENVQMGINGSFFFTRLNFKF